VSTPPAQSDPAATGSNLPELPRRPVEAHKGTTGTVSVVGGSCTTGTRMIGAPALSALAALRAGAGLARLVMPAPILNAGLVLCPSATGIDLPCSDDGLVAPHAAAEVMDRVIDGSTCIAIGPGLGTSPGAVAAVLRAVQQDRRPVVVDADAINALATIPSFMQDFHAAAVLTPHPGEFKRLVASLGLSGDLGLATSRERACEQLAQRLGRVVVLKGAGTVVSDGLRTWTCTSGHPCLATAGTGDVLTGVMAAVIAQYMMPTDQQMLRAKFPQLPRDASRPLDLYDSARIAVEAHARAGELWAEGTLAESGLLASELAGLIPAAMQELRG
jgi:NAD(P)H-hydrate epimerase